MSIIQNLVLDGVGSGMERSVRNVRDPMDRYARAGRNLEFYVSERFLANL